jgi:hypothetical protein
MYSPNNQELHIRKITSSTLKHYKGQREKNAKASGPTTKPIQKLHLQNNLQHNETYHMKKQQQLTD